MSSHRPAMETKRLWLRPFRFSDATEVQLMVNDRELALTTRSIDYPYPAGAAEHWIAQHQEFWESGKSAIFAITLRPDDRLVGAIGLEINAEDILAEMGYWIGRAYWNQGIATEAACETVKFGFEQLALNRITAHHMGINPASGRVLEKVGFRREGTLRQQVRKWGRFYDAVMYGILASEFRTTHLGSSSQSTN